MSDAVTREETLLNAIATGEAVDIVPVTRKEKYLRYLAGIGEKPIKPITREEMFLDKIQAGGGGITPTGDINITENGEFDVTEFAKAIVNVASSGGDSGLKIEYGTFKPSETINITAPNFYEIEHNLGVIPTVVMVMATSYQNTNTGEFNSLVSYAPFVYTNNTGSLWYEASFGKVATGGFVSGSDGEHTDRIIKVGMLNDSRTCKLTTNTHLWVAIGGELL